MRIDGTLHARGQCTASRCSMTLPEGLYMIVRCEGGDGHPNDIDFGQRVTITDEAAPQVDAALVERLRELVHRQRRIFEGGPAPGEGCALPDGATAMEQTVLLRDLLAAITAAPSPDAALDEATERAAEAWGVGVREVAVRLWNPDDPGLRYQASSPNADVMGYGPTRTAALEALAAKAARKLLDPEDMSYEQRMAEINERGVYVPLGASWSVALLRALRARDGVDETGKDEPR